MAGERSALIVATYAYDDERLARLRAPEQDAEALADVLSDADVGGFDVTTIINRPSYEVTRSVAQFFRNRRADDLLVLHFSCHGLKDDSGELYFAATDTSLDLLEATAIASASVNRVMDRSRAGRVVLFLDCCYSGAFARGMTARAGGPVDVNERLGGHGRAVITASTALQFAFEGDAIADGDPGAAHPSVFTSALVRGLSTGEADRDLDGWVSLDELYSYVHDEVTQENPDQTPTKWAFDIEGDLHVARRGQPVSTPAELPAPIRASMASLYAWERASATEPLAELLHGDHPGLALAARQALQALATADDSDRVRTAARGVLGSEQAPAPVPPAAEPGPTPTPPEPAPEPPPPSEPPVPDEPPVPSGPGGHPFWRRGWVLAAGAATIVVAVIVTVAALRGGDGDAGGGAGGSGLVTHIPTRYILLTQDGSDGPSQLVAASGDGTTVAVIDEPSARKPTIDHARDSMVYLRDDGDYGVPYLADGLTSHGFQHDERLFPAGTSVCVHSNRPSWSADDTRLAIICVDGSAHEQGSLRIASPDGTLGPAIEESPDLMSGPSWADDGTIYYAEVPEGERYDVLYSRADDGQGRETEVARCDPAAWLANPDWSRRGVLFTCSTRVNGPGKLMLARADGSQIQLGQQDVAWATWSPNGTAIAALYGQSPRLVTATYQEDADGAPRLGGWKELDIQGEVGEPAWGSR